MNRNVLNQRGSSRLLLPWYVTVLCFEGSLLSRRARRNETTRTKRETFETSSSRFRAFPTRRTTATKDVRGTLRPAVDAIPAEALADSERVPDRSDSVEREWRYRAPRLQEIPDRVLGRASAHLQDEQHHQFHPPAESLRFPQGDLPQSRSGL